jgi:hypothetical protein
VKLNNSGINFYMNGGTITASTGVYHNGATFNMEGNANAGVVELNLATHRINITGALTQTTAATITPYSYATGTQVLSGTVGLIAAHCAQFAVTGGVNYVDSDGRIAP